MLSDDEVFGTQSTPPVTSSGLSDEEVFGAAPQEQEQAGGLSDDEVFGVESPNILARGAQVVSSALGTAADFGINAAAGVADLATAPLPGMVSPITDYTDKLRDYGKYVRDTSSELVLSKEQQAAGNVAEKVGGNVLAVPAMLALKKAAAPMMTVVGAWDAATRALDAGESVGTAAAHAAIQGGANALGIALPMSGRTVGETVGLAIAGGPLIGGGADWASQKILNDEELKKMYDPLDPVNRATESVTSLAFGAVGHHMNRNTRAKQEADRRLKDDMNAKVLPELHTEVQQAFKVNEIPSYRKDGESWPEAMERVLLDREAALREARSAELLEGPDAPALQHDTSAAQVLEVIMHTADNPEQKARAKHMFDMAVDIGLDLTGVYSAKDFGARGMYAGIGDMISVDPNLTPNVKETMLHEIQHAITSRLIDAHDMIVKLEAEKKTLPTRLQELKSGGVLDAVKRFQDFHDYLRKRVKDSGDDPDNRDNWYGLSHPNIEAGDISHHPLKEALAEFFSTNRQFADKLRDMKMEGEDVKKYRPGLSLEFTHKFHEFTDSIRKTSDPNASTALDYFIEHYFNLLKHVDHSLRSDRTVEIPINDGKDTAKVQRSASKAKRGELAFAVDELAGKLKGNPLKAYFANHLYNAVANARTYDEFRVKALLASDDARWRRFVHELGPLIFDRAPFFARALREAGIRNFKNLTPEEKLFAVESRTAYEFLADEAKSADITDITAGGITMNFNNPTVLRQLITNGFAARAMKFVLDKMEQKHHYADKLFQEGKLLAKPFYDMSFKDRAAVMDIVSFYDTPLERFKLYKQKLNWPTDKMLARHLTPEQIEGYKARARMIDFGYNLQNQVHMAKYNEALIRLPGYMPHYHDGPFKVFVMNADGKTDRVQGFSTAMGAKSFAKRMQKMGHEVQWFDGKPYKAAIYQDISNPLLSHYTEMNDAFFNLERMGAAGVAELQRVQNESMSTFNKHFLEREDIAGYIGEMGASPDATWKLSQKLSHHVLKKSKVLEIDERWLKTVTEAWKNEMFMKDDFAPLMSIDTGQMNAQVWRGDLFEKLPEAYKYIAKASYNFIGKNVNHLNWIDNNIRKLSVRMGVDPNLYRQFARNARNFLSLIKLRVNPANYWNNAVQPVHTLSWLAYTDSMTGYKGNPVKAFNKVIQQSYKPDEQMQTALNWAMERRVLEPQLEYEMRAKDQSNLGQFFNAVTFGGVNPWIEKTGRKASFMIAFEHYREKFNGDVVKAREHAAQAVAPVMVNYDRLSRPLMYQDFGVAGELISPFAVFRNAYIGNTMLFFRAIKQDPKNIHKYAPLILSQLTYLSLAGTMGIIGASEYNMIADAVNTVWPTEDGERIPRLEDILMQIGTPDAIVFGGASELTRHLPGLKEGVYVGPSGAAIGLDDLTSAAMFPFINALASMTGLTYKQVQSMLAGSAPPTHEDVWKAGKQLIPGVLTNEFEQIFKGEGTDVAYTSSGFVGSVNRTPEGKNAIRFGGRMSVDETKRRIIERHVQRKEGLIKKQVADLVSLGASRAEGIRTTWTMDEIYEKAGKLGIEPTEMDEKINAEVMRRRTTAAQRDAEAATKGSAAAIRKSNTRESFLQ